VQEFRENRLQCAAGTSCRLETGMKIVLAIELIAGAVFVLVFWCD